MKRICEHFKALTSKLDQHLSDQVEEMEENASSDEADEGSQQRKNEDRWLASQQLADWTGRLASYLAQVIALKVQRIKLIGDKTCAAQLVSDIAFFKRTMQHCEAKHVIFDPDFAATRTLNQVQIAMVLDLQLIRVDPANREVRIDIEGSLASEALTETIRVIEAINEFTGPRLQEILADKNTALLASKRAKYN